jgi:O-antigen/teichoic acid export membrane protein
MDIKSKTLLSNTLIYGIGNFGSKILSFGLLPLYSYFLTREEFGYYDIIVTTVTLLVPLITLQLSEAIFRWLIIPDKDESSNFHTITNGFLLVFFNIIFISFVGIMGYLIYPLKYHLFIILLLITSSIFPVIQQSIRGFGKNKLYATSGVIYSVILLVTTVVLLIFFDLSILALIIASIFASSFSIIFLISQFNVFKYFRFDFYRKDFAIELLSYSWPLIPNTISWWLVNSANKYIILIFLGTAANGIFAFSSRLPAVLVMINSIFNLAWQESVILNYSKKDNFQFFKMIFDNMTKIYFSVAIILILYSKEIITLLLSNTFFEAWKYMPFLVLGVVMSAFAGFYGTFYLAEKKTAKLFYTTLAGGAVNIIISLLFIREYGLYAVSFGTFLGFCVIFITRFISFKSHLKPDIHYLLISILVFSFLIIQIDNNLLKHILSAIMTILVIVINLEQINKIKRLLFKKGKRLLIKR